MAPAVAILESFSPLHSTDPDKDDIASLLLVLSLADESLSLFCLVPGIEIREATGFPIAAWESIPQSAVNAAFAWTARKGGKA